MSISVYESKAVSENGNSPFFKRELNFEQIQMVNEGLKTTL